MHIIKLEQAAQNVRLLEATIDEAVKRTPESFSVVRIETKAGSNVLRWEVPIELRQRMRDVLIGEMQSALGAWRAELKALAAEMLTANPPLAVPELETAIGNAYTVWHDFLADDDDQDALGCIGRIMDALPEIPGVTHEERS